MQIGNRIREYRKMYNFSQEQLAEKLFVSRQTISNWENDKTYPDIQMIISLAILFNISLDELIRADLEEMKIKMNKSKENKQFNIYASLMMISTILASLALGLVMALPISKWFLPVPFILFLPALWSAFMLEKLKKNNDVKTYKEILAFIQNKDLEGLKRERDLSRGKSEKITIIFGYVALILIVCSIAYLIGPVFIK